MARQRFIHPEMWDDPVLGRLPEAEMLLYIACFSLADDHGRILGEPAWLRSHVFPYREMSVEKVKEMRDHLAESSSSFHVYEVDGIEYIYFSKWSDYQKPKYPKESTLPGPEMAGNTSKRPSRHGEIVNANGTQWVRRGYIKKHVRAAVYARDNNRCVNCGSDKSLQIDHIVAVTLGGSNEPYNLRTLCRSCNASKSNRPNPGETFLRNRETLPPQTGQDRVGLGRAGQGPEDPAIEETDFRELDPLRRLLAVLTDKDDGTERQIRKRVAQYHLGEGDLEEAREAALSPTANSPTGVAMSVLKTRGEAKAAA